jgi:peptidoglycan hydrolase CwlO-like protein
MKEIQDSRDLINILSDIHSDSTFNYNLEFKKKQKKLMNEVDYLEVIVNSLNQEADNLTALIDKIEGKLDILEVGGENL